MAPGGVDAVLDLVGTSTVLESLRMARRGGRVCLAGFLGGAAPIEKLDPRPSAQRQALQLLCKRLRLRNGGVPLSDVPLQQIVDLAEAGTLRAAPARVFAFADIQECTGC